MKTTELFARVAILIAVAVVSRESKAQLVVSTSPSPASGAQITLLDLSGTNPPRVLVSGFPCLGLASDEANQVLYWTNPLSPRKLYKAAYAASGALTPIEVGALSVAFNSLAWDSVDNKLVGETLGSSTIARGLYYINTTTAAITLAWGNTEEGLYGFDFDPGSNAFYAANNAIPNGSPGLSGRGLYRIGKPLSSPTITKIADFPNNGDVDLLGLAVGGGRLYIANSTSNATGHSAVYAFNISTSTYESSPAIPFTAADLSGATWAPGLLAASAGTDLAIAAGASQNCTVPVGGTMTFSVHVANYGAVASGPATVTVDLPSGTAASFAASTPPPTSITGTQLTYALSSIPGFGPASFADIRIDCVAANAPGATAGIAASVATAGDTNPANDTASASSTIQPGEPGAAVIKAVLSTRRTLANSLIPGTSGLHFADFNNPYSSANGNWWTIRSTSDTLLGGSLSIFQSVVVRSQTGGSPSLLLRDRTAIAPGPETTVLSNGPLVTINAGLGINDSGTVAFSGASGSPSTAFVAKHDGTTITDIARKDQAIPSMSGINYGTPQGFASIFNNGQVGFSFTSSPTGSTGYFANNGNTLLARQGVTTPTGASNVISTLITPTTGDRGLLFDATGLHSLYGAQLNTGSSSTSAVLVADGTVLMQTGVTALPGLTGAVSFLVDNRFAMGPDGMWMTMVTDATGRKAIARGYSTSITSVYKEGDPVFTGASEAWSSARAFATFADVNGFFSAASDAGGHFVVGGLTDAADTYADSVLVYDNAVVIARENDPVDLDGNGVFDDGVYIRAFRGKANTPNFTGIVAFTNDNAVIVAVSLRSTAAALCHLNDTEVCRALVRIPLPPKGACCNGTSCTVGIQLACAGTYKGDATTCEAPGNPITCCPANFDHVGGLSVADIFAFLTAWFNGDPQADFNGGGLSVSDIFTFLTAWFAGC